jgi:Fe2+ transport system protein FeoA
VKADPKQTRVIVEGQCAGPEYCPLSHVPVGTTVCIKQLATKPEMTSRLRELGFFEQQKVKLLTKESSLICQVCNARLGLSEKLADHILVEAVPVRKAAVKS